MATLCDSYMCNEHTSKGVLILYACCILIGDVGSTYLIYTLMLNGAQENLYFLVVFE